MKFYDYFKEAIAYGEALGLRNGTNQDTADILVELDEPRQVKSDELGAFHPSFLTVWKDLGLDINQLSYARPFLMTAEQQSKLALMFVSAYERYLADKKEPVPADSSK